MTDLVNLFLHHCHLFWCWKGIENVVLFWLVIMKVYTVLSINNNHLKVKSFIYWHCFATRSSRWVVLFKLKENNFFIEKLGAQQWKGQAYREIWSSIVLVNYATHIKRYGFIFLMIKKNNVKAFDIYGQIHYCSVVAFCCSGNAKQP